MEIAGHIIGVCSWSLHPKDTSDLVAQLKELELGHVQLALAPLVAMDQSQRAEQLKILRDNNIQFTAGMMSYSGEDYSTIAIIKQTGGFVPDDLWPSRRDATLAMALLAKELGIRKISTHIGFVPPSNDPKYPSMVQRVCDIGNRFAEMGLELGLETGQEEASELLQFLNDLPCRNVFVNFDPANMILYGAGDPLEAIRVLGRHIQHVHIKDAIASDQPGTVWGEEVPFGTGHVDANEFAAALHAVGYRGPLVIEREAGNERVADVATAIQTLRDAFLQ
jgi:sugar phosphate isomerase/epimerase